MLKAGWTLISTESNRTHACCERALATIHAESFLSESKPPRLQQKPHSDSVPVFSFQYVSA